jgi:dye decolorizing peroxidase/deferrochelatase/peroxidase EfeB
VDSTERDERATRLVEHVDDRSDRGGTSAGIRLSRRALLGTALATVGGAAAAGFAGGHATAAQRSSPPPSAEQDEIVSPFGGHQAGIATPPQRYATLVAVDLSVQDATALRRFLIDVSATVAHITRGEDPPPSPMFPDGAETPTDFATGLSPARLTVTVGVGSRVFEVPGVAAEPPRRLRPLPAFAGDRLDPRWSGGDMLFQICGDDAQVVSAAMRALRARMPGFASLRWTQSGFLSTPKDGATPRNMFGHKDGTSNPRTDSLAFDQTVWARPDEPGWFAGGTYLVFRKIRMKTADWDLTGRDEQDAVIGRRRSDGAPLTGAEEFDRPDLEATRADGAPVIASDAHIRRVHGLAMLRRSYNYDYGQLVASAGGSPDPLERPEDHAHAPGTPEHTHGGHGTLDVGLLFCAYGNDPDGQFIAAQQRMAQSDRLNRFIQHTGSAIFAVLPGFAEDGHLGDTLV